METIDIKRVQKKLLEMGKNIASILEANNVPYIITFGTLLGAVRHGGFIPWDDDFDFFLFDDTYDTAIELLRKELPKDMFLEDEKSESKYFHGWAHVKDMNSEVYCEQFPQDNLYNHHGLSVDLYKCKRIHSSELLDYRIVEMEKYLKRKLDKGIIDLSSYNLKRDILKEAIEKEEKNNPIEDSFIYGMAVKERFMFEKDIFPLKKISFDGVEFWGPNDSNSILQHFYGDYMQLPSEENRLTHYSKVIFKENL